MEQQKNNLRPNTVYLEQKNYAIKQNFTQPLVVMVETFRRSDDRQMNMSDKVAARCGSLLQHIYASALTGTV